MNGRTIAAYKLFSGKKISELQSKQSGQSVQKKPAGITHQISEEIERRGGHAAIENEYFRGNDKFFNKKIVLKFIPVKSSNKIVPIIRAAK